MSKPIQPAPAGWNKTIADLFTEVERGDRICVSSPEIDWAQNYEQSLIPAGVRFPKKGDIYEALDDTTVLFLTVWAAPFSNGGKGLLKKGEQVGIDDEPYSPREIGINAVAIDYDVLEKRLIPAADRNEPKYGGFYFVFRTVDLIKKFKLVHSEEDLHS